MLAHAIDTLRTPGRCARIWRAKCAGKARSGEEVIQRFGGYQTNCIASTSLSPKTGLDILYLCLGCLIRPGLFSSAWVVEFSVGCLVQRGLFNSGWVV